MISEKGGRELGSLASVTLMVHALPLTPLKTLETSRVFFILTSVDKSTSTLCVNRHVL